MVPAASDPPVSVIEEAVELTEPPQVVVPVPLVVTPVGKGSVMLKPVSATPEVLLSVTTSRLVPPGEMVDGENDFETAEPLTTVSVAVAAL